MKFTAALRTLARAALLILVAGDVDVSGASDNLDSIESSFPGKLPPKSQKRGSVKEVWPWYHSADEIHDRLSQLAGQCANANIDVSTRSEINSGSAAGSTVDLDVVHISRSGGNEPKTKAMFIFGEHAREIISPETALNFVETLCGNGPEAKRASSVLDNVSFTIVPNANPISRKLVEDGYYCRRTNEDGVDLNRNFGDTHRETGDEPGEEMNPGSEGFSEPESKIIKGLIDEERPEIYISVHSGAYLLGLPYGYNAAKMPDNEANMLEVLGPISEKYCQGECPYGNLAEMINYENPGCDIDYVADTVNSPYVFTWEIYVGEQFRQRYVDEARMQREQRGSPGGPVEAQESFVQKRQEAKQLRGGLKKKRGQTALQVGAEVQGPEAAELVDSCIDQFNPQTEEETNGVVSKWTGAFLELCEEVSAKKGKSAAAAAAASTAAAAASTASSLSLAFGSSTEAAEATPSEWDFK